MVKNISSVYNLKTVWGVRDEKKKQHDTINVNRVVCKKHNERLEDLTGEVRMLGLE